MPLSLTEKAHFRPPFRSAVTWTSGSARVLVLDGVADQVLEELRQLHLVGHHGRQGIVGHERPAVLDGTAEVGQRVSEGVLTRGRERVPRPAVPTRE